MASPSRRQLLGQSLSTGQLMRLASQVGRDSGELLSLTAAERMCDPETQSAGHYASAPSFHFASRKGNGLHIPPRRRAVWSQDEYDTDETGDDRRHDRGVSLRTRQANSSQQEAAAKLDTTIFLQGKKSSPGMRHESVIADSPGSRKQTLDMTEAEFDEEVTAMEGRMVEMGKSIQMTRYSKEDKEAKANEEREAEKRRREAELRRARMRELAARDPHRKIQLKLENKRRFGMDGLDQASIPIINVSVQGHSGGEKTHMVDVQALRSKCQGLTEGIHSVSKLVEMQQRKENSVRQSSSGFTGNMMLSSSMPSIASEVISPEESLQPSRANCRDRHLRSGAQRHGWKPEKTAHKGTLTRTR